MKGSHSPFNQVFGFGIFLVCFLLICSLLLYSSFFAFKRHSPSYTENTEFSEFTVIIDAGHGGEDGGAIGTNGSLEKDINLLIAKKVRDILSAKGIKCVLTREEDILLYDRNQDYRGRKKLLDMQARIKIAESCENAVFVSIHQNSFSQSKYSGFQAYYSPNDPRSLELVTLIEKNVKSILQPSNRRTAKLSNGSIYLLDRLNCPAVLLECGFLSNAEECALLSSDEYQNKLAAVFANSISDFVSTKAPTVF